MVVRVSPSTRTVFQNKTWLKHRKACLLWLRIKK